MAENSAIEWTDHTFNPWEGCQKVGPGCDHCYAETRNARYGGGTAPNWGPGAPRRRTLPANWRKPLAWQRNAAAFFAEHGRRQRVFCASLADVFDNAVDPVWRIELATLIAKEPDLDWLLLTKRIGNAAAMLQAMFDAPAYPPANVWLGATVVNQAEADRDVPKLLAAPAARRFLSMEPLLGPVDLTKIAWDVAGYGMEGALRVPDEPDDFRYWSHETQGIDWVIVGGESGPGARPMHPHWARSLRDQCAAAGVPFLFKQWGDLAYTPLGDQSYPHASCIMPDGSALAYSADPAATAMPRAVLGDHDQFWRAVDAPPIGAVEWKRVGKKAAGRLLDGVQHDGVPV